MVLACEEKMEKGKTVKARILVRKVTFGYADVEIPVEETAGAKNMSSLIIDYVHKNCVPDNLEITWTDNTGVIIGGGYALPDNER